MEIHSPHELYGNLMKTFDYHHPLTVFSLRKSSSSSIYSIVCIVSIFTFLCENFSLFNLIKWKCAHDRIYCYSSKYILLFDTMSRQTKNKTKDKRKKTLLPFFKHDRMERQNLIIKCKWNDNGESMCVWIEWERKLYPCACTSFFHSMCMWMPSIIFVRHKQTTGGKIGVEAISKREKNRQDIFFFRKPK